MEKTRTLIRYQKFQFGWVIVTLFIIVLGFMTFAYLYQWGNNPIDKASYIFIMVLLGGIILGFHGITVLVTEKQIIIKLGIGFYTKKIDLSNVKSVSIINYPIYYGYGIRLIPNGWLYNVSGRHAVEIKFKNKKNVIQIGTNDWDNLRSAIEKSINSDKQNDLL